MSIIDVHGHVGAWMFPIQARDASDLERIMAACGVEQIILSHVAALTYNFVEGNAQLAEIIAERAALWGYVVLNPHYPNQSRAELKKYLDHPKFVGVKLHPEIHKYRLESPGAMRLLERVAETGLPVLVHAFPGQISGFSQAAASFPEIKFIMGHMGGDQWPRALEAVAVLPNVYLDPCCSFPDADKIQQAVQTVGAGRVVFGSDANLFNPAFVWGLIQDAGLSEAELAQIATENARDIFSLRDA